MKRQERIGRNMLSKLQLDNNIKITLEAQNSQILQNLTTKMEVGMKILSFYIGIKRFESNFKTRT